MRLLDCSPSLRTNDAMTLGRGQANRIAQETRLPRAMVVAAGFKAPCLPCVGATAVDAQFARRGRPQGVAPTSGQGGLLVQCQGSIALRRSRGPASAEAMKLRNALASSFCSDTVNTPAANRTVSCNSFGSGPM